MELTIGKKLALSGGLLLATVVAIGCAAFSGLTRLGSAVDTTANHAAPELGQIGELRASIANMAAQQRGVALFSILKDASGAEAARSGFDAASNDLKRITASLRPSLLTDEGRRAVDAIENGLNEWLPIYQKTQRVSGGESDSSLAANLDRTSQIAARMDDNARQLVEIRNRLLASQSEDATSTTSSFLWMVGLLTALAIVAGAGVLFGVRRIIADLGAIATDMGEGAEQVASAGSQISSSSQSLAQGASEQAASLEETSASSEEITSMTRKNAQNSQVAADLMTQVDRRIGDANHTLEQMIVSMHEINAASDKIARIIKVIDEIAFQTNILALNAAVEAARAGEAGMGFAVVADEVRNLAHRSAQAAKDTSAMIEESITKANEGSSKLNQVADAIRSITESAEKVKTLVDEVNLGSQEQARGIEQIAKAITQIEQVTQKTAANAEESAAASEELQAQAQAMRSAATRLRGLTQGGAGNSGAGIYQPRSSALKKPAGANGRRESGGSLNALKKAIAHPIVSAAAGAHSLASVESKLAKDVFPLDEDFKEF